MSISVIEKEFGSAEVIYSSEEIMSLSKDQEANLLRLLERPTGLGGLVKVFIREWSGPVIAILGLAATLIAGLHYFVKPDRSTLTESLNRVHEDIVRIDGSVDKVNGRIDTLLDQALQRAFPVLPSPAQKDKGPALRNSIDKVQAIVAMAKVSNATLDQQDMAAASRKLAETAKVDPSLAEVAWKTTGSMLDYSSSVTPLPVQPEPIRWVGPAPKAPEIPGLFGFTEMKDIQSFGSEKRVPLDRASRSITLGAEQRAVDFLKSKGYTTWPEFEMIVGGDDSNIVLDKLHLRNVILKHMHVVYGGGEARLENVTFVDCTFEFVRTERTIQLSDLLLRRQAITAGL